MIDTFIEFIKFIGDNLIKGIFISVLLVIFITFISKNKTEIDFSIKIIKWIIIIYSFGVLIGTLLLCIFKHSEKYTFLERATGPYWWAYWLIFTMNSIIPLFLLNKRIGKNIYFLLFITVLMNIGWLFESFVIHITSLNTNYITENYNPYIPNSGEILILMNGFILGIVLLIIGIGINKWWKPTKLAKPQ